MNTNVKKYNYRFDVRLDDKDTNIVNSLSKKHNQSKVRILRKLFEKGLEHLDSINFEEEEINVDESDIQIEKQLEAEDKVIEEIPYKETYPADSQTYQPKSIVGSINRIEIAVSCLIKFILENLVNNECFNTGNGTSLRKQFDEMFANAFMEKREVNRESKEEIALEEMKDALFGVIKRLNTGGVINPKSMSVLHDKLNRGIEIVKSVTSKEESIGIRNLSLARRNTDTGSE